MKYENKERIEQLKRQMIIDQSGRCYVCDKCNSRVMINPETVPGQELIIRIKEDLIEKAR